jgi:hypothetical protein
MVNKYYVKERWLYDPERGLLHDLKGTKDPENRPCGLETISRPILFDAKTAPAAGERLRIKTPGGRKDVLVAGHCQHCL